MEVIILINEIIDEINHSNNILVAGHIGPDGDDISSVISLVIGLEKYGKRAIGVIDDIIPAYLDQFDLVKEKIRDFECIEKNPCDLIIIVDTSSPDRVGNIQKLFDYRRIIVIDHHNTNTNFGHINWVDSSFASTAEMIYLLNSEMNIDYDEQLSTINLLGIATDTGFFRYSNTNENVFKIAAKLVSLGAKISEISNKILESKPINEFLIIREFLDEMKFELDNKIVYSISTLDILKKYNIEPINTPSFVGEMRSIKGVEVAIMVNQSDENLYHFSFRSKEYVDVSKIAFNFGGGGHPRASGFSIKTENINSIIEDVIKETKKYF